MNAYSHVTRLIIVASVSAWSPVGSPLGSRVSIAAEKPSPTAKSSNKAQELLRLFEVPEVIKIEAQQKKLEKTAQDKKAEAEHRQKLIQQENDRIKAQEEAVRKEHEAARKKEIEAQEWLQRQRKVLALGAAEKLAVRQAEDVANLRQEEADDIKEIQTNVQIYNKIPVTGDHYRQQLKEAQAKYSLDWKKLKARHQREQRQWQLLNEGIPFEFDQDPNDYRSIEMSQVGTPNSQQTHSPPAEGPSATPKKQPEMADTADAWLQAQQVADWCTKLSTPEAQESCFHLTKGKRFTRTALNACASLPYFQTHTAHCLTAVANKTFEPALVKYCTDLGDGSNLDHKLNCIMLSAGASVQSKAVETCSKIDKSQFGNWAVDCLKVIIGKTFDPSDLGRCGIKPYPDEIVHCLYRVSGSHPQSNRESLDSRSQTPQRQPPRTLGLPNAPGRVPNHVQQFRTR